MSTSGPVPGDELPEKGDKIIGPKAETGCEGDCSSDQHKVKLAELNLFFQSKNL